MVGIAGNANSRKNGRKSHLYHQMLMVFGGCLLIVGAVTLGINYRLVQRDIKQQVTARAESIAQTLEFSTEGLLEASYSSILQRVVQNFATLPAVVEIAIVDPSKHVLAQGPDLTQTQAHKLDNPALAQQIAAASSSGVGSTRETVLNERSILTYCLPFSSPLFQSSSGRGVVLVTIDLQQMQQETWKIFLTTTTTMAVGTLLFTMAIGLLLKKYLLTPLTILNKAVATSQATKQFSAPSNLPQNEIRFLAETFQQVFQQQYRIESDLRHSEEKERQNAQQLTKTLKALKSTQSQLIQTEKMAGLGQVVAGIAHEINNPVNFIHGNLKHATTYFQDLIELINGYQREYPVTTTAIQKIQENIEIEFLLADLPKLLDSTKLGTERIRDIVLSLRTFSRLDESDFKAVDIANSLESTLLLLNARLSSKAGRSQIQIIRNYGVLPLIDCYSSQLNQVFLNILTNAMDALETIETEKVQWQPQIEITTVQQDNRCLITITDNGPGIPADVLPHIFDPFFTTKPVGQGTGLGLSVGYQVVASHGGNLRCHSSAEQGTQFVIELPMRQGGSVEA